MLNEIFRELLLRTTKLKKCNFAFSAYVAQSGIYTLQWSTLLIVCGWKCGEEIITTEIRTIIEAQALILGVIYGAGDTKISNKAYHVVS